MLQSCDNREDELRFQLNQWHCHDPRTQIRCIDQTSDVFQCERGKQDKKNILAQAISTRTSLCSRGRRAQLLFSSLLFGHRLQETVEFADGSSRMVPVAGSTAKVREVARPTVANTVTGRWRQPGPKRGSPTRERPSEPDSAMSAARQKVTSLEAALNVLVGHSGSQVHVLKAALQKAKERPLTEQLAFTESFIERSRKRIEVLETKKAEEVALLEQAMQQQQLSEWLDGMNCELRDALDAGDMESAKTLSGLISRGAAKIHFHCRQHGAVRRVTLWGMRGGREATLVLAVSHGGPSPVSAPQCRSSGWW